MSKPWFSLEERARQAPLRLFCLPWAGGGAGSYRSWQAHMPTGIAVVPVQLPGRENRLSESAASSFGKILDVLAPLMALAGGGAFALFGHSMGAHLAMALTHRLREMGAGLPEHIVLSARRAPHLDADAPLMGDMPDEELARTLRGRYGMAGADDDDTLLDLMLPTIRADIQATESWPTRPAPPLSMPMTIMGGIDDLWVAPSGLGHWQDYTTGRCEMRLFPGGHFYLTDNLSPVDYIGERLVPHLPGGG